MDHQSFEVHKKKVPQAYRSPNFDTFVRNVFARVQCLCPDEQQIPFCVWPDMVVFLFPWRDRKKVMKILQNCHRAVEVGTNTPIYGHEKKWFPVYISARAYEKFLHQEEKLSA